MEEIKREMKQEAEKKHGKIYPAGKLRNFEDCFTVEEGKVLFWFNVEDQTTKTMARELKN